MKKEPKMWLIWLVIIAGVALMFPAARLISRTGIVDNIPRWAWFVLYGSWLTECILALIRIIRHKRNKPIGDAFRNAELVFSILMLICMLLRIAR